MPTWKSLGRRAGAGAAIGAAGAVLVVAVAMATGGAAMARSQPAMGLLAVGLVKVALLAVRDELMLRGIVLRATRALLPAWAALLVCGAAAAAARFGAEGAVGLFLVVEALRGIVLAALWLRDRGAWMAVAANAAWMWGLGSIVRGGLVDVRFAAEPDAGVPALVVLAAAVGAAAFWSLRSRDRSAPSAPN
jgi:hypothetical protein